VDAVLDSLIEAARELRGEIADAFGTGQPS
jgi:hypothetical protein